MSTIKVETHIGNLLKWTAARNDDLGFQDIIFILAQCGKDIHLAYWENTQSEFFPRGN